MKTLGEIMIVSGIFAGIIFVVTHQQEYLSAMGVFGVTGITLLVIKEILK